MFVFLKMNHVATLFTILFLCSVIVGQKNLCKLEVDKSPPLRGLRLGMTPDQVGKVLKMDIRLKPEYTTVFMTKVRGAWTDFNKGKNGLTFFEQLSKDKIARAKYDRERRAAEHEVDAGEKLFSYFYSHVNKDGNSKNELLDGVEYFFLRFYRESLYSISINYKTDDLTWKDSKDFALAVSATLDLPEAYWVQPGYMSCPGFSLHAYGNGDYSSLDLRDTRKSAELTSEAQRLFIQAEKDAVIERRERELEERRKKAASFKP